MSAKLEPDVMAAYLRSISNTALRISECSRLQEICEVLESIAPLKARLDAALQDTKILDFIADKTIHVEFGGVYIPAKNVRAAITKAMGDK